MLRSHCCFCILCAILGLALAMLLLTQGQPDAAAQPPAVSFINDIAPVLRENCFACHDARQKKGKLDMTSYAGLRHGGTKDDPVAPGKPEESVIVDLLKSNGTLRMPPRETGPPLPKEKIDLIARWIKEGARLDAGIDEKADLVRELRARWKPPAPPARYAAPVNINAMAFTPDGKRLVVGGYHELTVWAAAQGTLERRVATRAERTYGMAFLPDGTLAVAGGRPGQEGDVRVYDLSGGRPGAAEGVAMLDGVNDRGTMLTLLADGNDAFLAVALSPNGKRLAAAGCDRTVRVWDVSAGAARAKLEQTFENHTDWVFGLAFSPDGGRVLTASRDRTAKIWELVTKETVVTFPEHQSPVYAVAMTQDRKTAISCGEDGNVRYWDASDKSKKPGKQQKIGGKHVKPALRMAYHPDAKTPLLATCGADGTVRLWNAAKATALRTLTGHTDWIYAVAISPDGKQVAAGGWDGEVRVWNSANGQLVRAFNASPGYDPTRDAKK